MKTQSNPTRFGLVGQSAKHVLMAVTWLLASLAAHADPLVVTVVGVSPDGSTQTLSDYRWTVEQDATKLSVPGQPATTKNYSFSFHRSYMPVVAAGRVGNERNTQLASQDPDVQRINNAVMPEVCAGAPEPNCLVSGDLVDHRYYVSIAASGYQMGGAPIVVSGNTAQATVYLNKHPVPTSQISVFAFNDNSPINGAPDLPQELGLEGFTVQIMEAGGTYGQSGGAVTQDGFGNPLGTTYNADGSVKVRGSGIVKTGPDGTAVIKNLFPAKYTIFMVPPPGSDWHQTSTIEGTKGSDAWVKNNEPAFFQEFGPPGHHVFLGFTKSGCIQGSTGNRCTGLTGEVGNRANNTIKGRIVNIHNSRTPNYAFEKGSPVPECWVGLNQTGGGTDALYVTACNKDSTFTIPNVPRGTYELVVWDEPLDMIIGTQIINVANGINDLQDVPVFSWFGRLQGRVFQDIDGTGLPFFAEDFSKPYVEVDPVTGLEREVQKTFRKGDLKPSFGSGIASNIRFRDGSIYQSVATKQDGTYAFTEVFPFFNWMISEIDYARFKATGATSVPDAGGAIDPAANAAKLWNAEIGSYGSNDPAYAYNPWARLNPQLQTTCSATDVTANTDASGKFIDPTGCIKEGDQYYWAEKGSFLVAGIQTFLGQTNHMEWGKAPFAGQINGAKDENGGISGIVHYAITRAEDDPRFAAAENWEPGVPRVQVTMYLDCDGDTLADQPLNDGTSGCAQLSSQGYVAKLADVDNYPYCWRDPDSCGLTVAAKGPEDRERSGDGVTFSYGDVFKWGGDDPANPGQQLHTAVSVTDSWDDSLPEDCVKAPVGPVGNGSIPFAADLDCFDGLYNFNQIRPSVFDGGYGFGRVANQAELPVTIGNATYIVEAAAPPGYLHVGSGDQNVAFGDELKAATAALPADCVGMELPVPEFLTLFPDEANPSYTGPDDKWRKCDMKSVAQVPGANPAADFFLFTEAPVSAHGVGFILDDTATEFNRFSPSFGEKYAPPHLPVSVQDWTGREINRVYSDQFGSYNYLTPSSYTINPPYPSGVMPNMLMSCMNHPGPIPDPSGAVDALTGAPKMVIDPFFNRKYTQFCYTLQYLAGKTTYLDTPVLPIAAFASVEKNPLDCECQDGTPAIYSASNAQTNNGPWVSTSGGQLIIVSAGPLAVTNPNYDPTNPASPKQITRDYSFGATLGSVKLGSTALNVSVWTPDLIVVNVPANTATGQQLNITRGDNSKESVVGITVHVGGNQPKVVQPGQSIQAVIDDANTQNGDLITIPPGAYNEFLILDKRVRLQGWGANSVGINASKAAAGSLVAWRQLLNKKLDLRCAAADGVTPIPGSDPANCPATTPLDADTNQPTIVVGANRTFDILPGQTPGIDAANNEPVLFGAEEGPGILAVGRSNNANGCANAGVLYQIDGVTVTGSDSGGGILASGYNCNLRITNNRVVGNYGTYGGGVRVGHTALVVDTAYTDGVNRNVVVDHNWISQNGASEIATGDGGGGGVTMGPGSNNYAVTNNYVCGNFSMSDGGGVSHVGFSGGTNALFNNKILLNQTFNQSADPTGGGVFIGGQVPLAGGAGEGTGRVNVDRNLIQYNQAGAGAGGGVSIVRTNNDSVLLTNNMITNNSTAYTGGGVSVADGSANVRLVNNTVSDNVSTATNRQSFPPGQKVQSSPQVAGISVVGGADPTLLNNIVSGNRAFTWSITPANPAPNQVQTTALTEVFGWNLGRVGSNARGANALPNTSTAFYNNSGPVRFVKPIDVVSLTDPDQPVVLPETTILQTALTFDEGGNFINVIMSPLTPWDLTNPATLRSDYHINDNSPARNAGSNRTAANGVPVADIDGQNRASSAADPVDVGADEFGTGNSGVSSLTLTAESGAGTLFPNGAGGGTLLFGPVGDNTLNTLTYTAGGTAPSIIGQAAVATTFSTFGGTRYFIQSDTCSNRTLVVGDTCTIQVRFQGNNGAPFFAFGINPATGTLSVPSNGPASPIVLTMFGS